MREFEFLYEILIINDFHDIEQTKFKDFERPKQMMVPGIGCQSWEFEGKSNYIFNRRYEW